jgi:FKBP-type peptidyl-prolyl cis-trans isomerase
MRNILFLFFTTLIIGACGTKKIVEAKPVLPVVIQPKPLMNETDSISYAFGLFTAETFKKIQEESDGKYILDIDQFAEGIREMLKDSPRLSEEAKESVMKEFSLKMETMAKEKQDIEMMKVKTDGLQFLTINAKKEGMQTTASGLQYKILKEGDGVTPKETDKVSVHYVGMLLDGSIFDSSRERGEPASFGLNQVISGWTEGLQLMKVGATYEFYIPSDLAYGSEGNQSIPGGSVLKFEVELLGIE